MRLEPYAAALAGPPQAFTLDRVTYRLLPAPWSVLADRLTGDWQLPVLMELVDDDAHDALWGRLEDDDDPLGVKTLEPVALNLVERAAGMEWWRAATILSVVHGPMWAELDGTLLMSGVDLTSLIAERPARAINVIYGYLVKDADKKGRDKIDAIINKPPAGLAASVPLWDAESEGSAFMAAMARGA